MKNLNSFITSSNITRSVNPNIGGLIEYLKSRQKDQKVVKLFYGETYDDLGMTIDSLKYYFFISLIHKYLQSLGLNVKSFIIQADVASTINKSAKQKEFKIFKQLNYRLRQIEKIKEIYKLPFKVALMSDLFKTKEYEEKIELVNNFVSTNEGKELVFPYLEKTVLKNKISQEYKSNFQYGLEAMATSLLFDIKVGPPREIYYDKAANIISDNNLNSIYLTPSYPLGKDFIYFLTHPEIEEYGLTPYKARSNQLQNYRIILEQTKKKDVKHLIKSSFESNNKLTAHPVLDMYIVADMGKRLKLKNYDLPIHSLKLLDNIETLKQKTINHLDKNIFLQLGGIYEK